MKNVTIYPTCSSFQTVSRTQWDPFTSQMKKMTKISVWVQSSHSLKWIRKILTQQISRPSNSESNLTTKNSSGGNLRSKKKVVLSNRSFWAMDRPLKLSVRRILAHRMFMSSDLRSHLEKLVKGKRKMEKVHNIQRWLGISKIARCKKLEHQRKNKLWLLRLRKRVRWRNISHLASERNLR